MVRSDKLLTAEVAKGREGNSGHGVFADDDFQVQHRLAGVRGRVWDCQLLPPSAPDYMLVPYDLPFTFFQEGGEDGGGGFVWTGVAGALLIVLGSGVALGWSWKWLFLSNPD
jgi:hypothetical protein